MKTKILVIVLVQMFFVINLAQAEHFLYRKNGGEVISVSVNPYTLSGDRANEYDQVEDPPVPDGNDLGVRKIYDAGTIRNATAPEISNFATAEADDNKLFIRSIESADLEDSTTKQMALKGLALVTLGEINRIVDRIVAIENCIETAANLGSVKTCVSGLTPKPFPNRIKAQIIPAIQGKIKDGSAD